MTVLTNNENLEKKVILNYFVQLIFQNFHCWSKRSFKKLNFKYCGRPNLRILLCQNHIRELGLAVLSSPGVRLVLRNRARNIYKPENYNDYQSQKFHHRGSRPEIFLVKS